MKNFLEKHVKQYDIGIAVVMLLTFLCCMFQPMYAADRALTDQMWQQPEGTNAKIKIIKIDEKTLSELGQYNTWTKGDPGAAGGNFEPGSGKCACRHLVRYSVYQ